MEITNKTELNVETERFKLLLQQNFGFITTRQAQDLFAKCLGHKRIESLQYALPVILNAETKVDPSFFIRELSSGNIKLSHNEVVTFFPFLLDPVKKSNEDVIKKLEKCYSGLYNVCNVHLEVVGDNAGYHIANFILEGDLSGAKRLVDIVQGLRNIEKRNNQLDQVIKRLTLSSECHNKLGAFYSMIPTSQEMAS